MFNVSFVVHDPKQSRLPVDRFASDSKVERILVKSVAWVAISNAAMRHAGVGYDIASDCAKRQGMNLLGIIM